MSFTRTHWVIPSPRYSLPPGRHSVPASLWLIVFLLLALSASAQQATKDLGDASLEELGKIQVYGASKHLQSTSDAPASVTIITAD
jgi:hypothetical protein